MELAAALVGLLVLIVPVVLSRMQDRREEDQIHGEVEDADAHLSLKLDDPVAGRTALARQLERLHREARRKRRER